MTKEVNTSGRALRGFGRVIALACLFGMSRVAAAPLAKQYHLADLTRLRPGNRDGPKLARPLLVVYGVGGFSQGHGRPG